VFQDKAAVLPGNFPCTNLHKHTQMHLNWSWTVTGIMTRKRCGILAAPRIVPVLEIIAKPSHEVVSMLVKVPGTIRTIFTKILWGYLT